LQYVSARFFDIRKKCEFVCQGNNFEIVSPQNFPTKSDNGRG